MNMPCCDAHVDGPTRDNGMAACCDTNDCGPCCPDCPTCPKTSTVPKRRIQLRLNLQADTVADVISAITQVEFDLEWRNRNRQETAEITSGGYHSGWRLEMTCNPDQTGQQYREQLAAWSKAQKAAKAEAAS